MNLDSVHEFRLRSQFQFRNLVTKFNFDFDFLFRSKISILYRESESVYWPRFRLWVTNPDIN